MAPRERKPLLRLEVVSISQRSPVDVDYASFVFSTVHVYGTLLLRFCLSSEFLIKLEVLKNI